MYSTKAHAKVNIFLKITGRRSDGYHSLASRFVQVRNLYDTITFVPQECERFTIEGVEGVEIKDNTIYKAYKALNATIGDLDVLEFFYRHKVVVVKRIPSGAGLGGGSSDAGAFLRLVKEACNLLVDIDTLAQIGAQVGADVPFFVYDYPSANVTGIGEIVKPFDEEPPSLEIFTPPIHCDSGAVYQAYDAMGLDTTASHITQRYLELSSSDILMQAEDTKALNDLYLPALHTCPKLSALPQVQEGWFLSGSGSSLFRLSAPQAF